MANLKTVLASKETSVRAAIVAMATKEGVAMPQKSVMEALVLAYLLVVQALWIRVIDIAFILKYAVVAPRVSALLKKFAFIDIVRTMRANYTTLYTSKTSKGRKYTLNYDTFLEFVGRLESGKLAIYTKKTVEKPQKEAKMTKKNSLATQLFNSFAQNTSTPTQNAVAAKPKTPKATQKDDAKVKEKPITKGRFDAIAVKDMVVGKFYRVAVKNQEKKLYVWLDSVSSAGEINLRDYKKVVVAVKISDIVAVEGYTKAVYAQ